MVTGGGGETDRKVRNEDAASSGRRGEQSHPLTSNNHAVTESVTVSKAGQQYTPTPSSWSNRESPASRSSTPTPSKRRRIVPPANISSIDDDKAETLAIDTDLRCRFRPSSIVLLERAFVAQREITLLNPLWIHSKNTRKPFFRTEDPAPLNGWSSPISEARLSYDSGDEGKNGMPVIHLIPPPIFAAWNGTLRWSSFRFTSSLLEPGGLGSEAVSCEQQISKIVKTWTPKALKMGSVELYLHKVLKQMADGFSAIRMEFRMACAGEGVPPKKVQDMFHSSGWTSPEGLGLSACRKILKLMNGEVQYIRESDAGRFTTKEFYS
ncbi:hypothetical protein DY000_02053994 [Brassica cretica]|uniref:Histidine kinase/HSP90-like ATPase domain-containing protein n=1 Tax=Brassica cretica TaxID=69181 RepID=A0ABQ7A9W4_BRACR|nr:hypothetical protein DY000_02053994 [Brassica cretica]